MTQNVDVIEKHNKTRLGDLQRDYDVLGEKLDRRCISVDSIRQKVAGYGVACRKSCGDRAIK